MPIIYTSVGSGGGGGGAAWGDITGTLSDQTDLQSALDAKLDSVDLIWGSIGGDLPDQLDLQAALDLKANFSDLAVHVPYLGANDNLDMDIYDISAYNITASNDLTGASVIVSSGNLQLPGGITLSESSSVLEINADLSIGGYNFTGTYIRADQLVEFKDPTLLSYGDISIDNSIFYFRNSGNLVSTMADLSYVNQLNVYDPGMSQYGTITLSASIYSFADTSSLPGSGSIQVYDASAAFISRPDFSYVLDTVSSSLLDSSSVVAFNFGTAREIFDDASALAIRVSSSERALIDDGGNYAMTWDTVTNFRFLFDGTNVTSVNFGVGRALVRIDSSVALRWETSVLNDAAGSPVLTWLNSEAQFDVDVKIATVGKGLYIKEGTDATMGTVTLSSGIGTVSTTKVTASSRIFLQWNGGTPAVMGNYYILNITPGTSFEVYSTNVADDAVISWLIIEPL